MKTAPTNARGPPRAPPAWTAPTSVPMATANTAGSTPRRNRTVHHAAVSAPSARGRVAKNFHSLRARTVVPIMAEPGGPRGVRQLAPRRLVHQRLIHEVPRKPLDLGVGAAPVLNHPHEHEIGLWIDPEPRAGD